MIGTFMIGCAVARAGLAGYAQYCEWSRRRARLQRLVALGIVKPDAKIALVNREFFAVDGKDPVEELAEALRQGKKTDDPRPSLEVAARVCHFQSGE